MSAFVVEDTTINRVTTYLETQTMHNGYLACELAAQGYGRTAANGRAQQTCEDFMRLGRDMFALNVEAVEQRYGEGEAKEFRPLDFASRYALAGTIQVYKALQCWLYQCSEGDVPERPLFKLFDHTIKAYLAHEIIQALPAYDAAPWS